MDLLFTSINNIIKNNLLHKKNINLQINNNNLYSSLNKKEEENKKEEKDNICKKCNNKIDYDNPICYCDYCSDICCCFKYIKEDDKWYCYNCIESNYI